MAALRDGATQLITPPFAACYLGLGYFEALLADLRLHQGGIELTVCCGDDPAIAHEALRRGFTRIVCDAPEPVFGKLRAIADAQGAVLFAQYPA